VPYTPRDVHLHAAPMFPLADLGYAIAALAAGSAHAFLPRFAPEAFFECIARTGASATLLAPAMIAALVQAPALAAADLRSWRRLMYGGAPIAAPVLEAALAQLPCALIQGYGQTEATHTITTLTDADHRRIATQPGLALSCGRPAPGVTVALFDESDHAVPAGAPGEVCVRAATVMPGYWRRPVETAAALRGGWLRTGDVGRLDESGYLTLLDRRKDMIVSGAENIYSVEVENALAAHQAVAEAAVIAVPDARWGERVHAVVALAPGRTATADELQAHCRTLIGGYKLPRSIEFVAALPRSATGKIRKDMLRAPHWEGRARQIG
jgi:acyl-CoA synthetase (AMP-forming)/AMP-acid ligase II